LGKFYNLQLDDRTRAYIVHDAFTWGALGRNAPMKMKMRRFFADNNWMDALHSVDLSTSGQKGGVIFLYKKQPDPNQQGQYLNVAAPQPAFVVKLTNSPEQMLFAEYVLKQIGQAKIPKGLVIELDWSDFGTNNTDGMQLVDFICNHPAPMLAQDQTKSAAYNSLKNNQFSGDQSKALPAYLMVMKCFAGDQITPVAEKLNQWLGTQWVLNSNSRYNQLTTSQKSTPAFLAICQKIARTKAILGSQQQMKKLGRVLAADTLLGNSDRFEEGNVDNAFFITKQYANPLKIANPIGVIDNDAFLPVWNPNNLHPDIQRKQRPTSVEKYLSYLLQRGYELDPLDRAHSVKLSSVEGLLTDFDNYFLDRLFENITKASVLPLIADIYTTIQPAFPIINNGYGAPAWMNAKQWIKAGFVEGLAAIQTLNMNEYWEIWDHLVQNYTPNHQNNNFDWTAFEVRCEYIKLAQVDVNHGTFTFPNKDDAFIQVSMNYFQNFPLIAEITAALNYGKRNNVGFLTQAEASQIADSMALFSSVGQSRFVLAVPQDKEAEYGSTDRVLAARCLFLKMLQIEVTRWLISAPADAPKLVLHRIARILEPRKSELERVKFYQPTTGVLKSANKAANDALNKLAADVSVNFDFSQ
jgi:hypothetical protein